jgi:hypothetical protein
MTMVANEGQPLHIEGCLFCRRANGGFRSRERPRTIVI